MSHEFKVVLDGIDLEDQQVSQVDTAVRQAVLHSLATLNIPCHVGVEFPLEIHGIIIYHPIGQPLDNEGEIKDGEPPRAG